MTTILSFMVNIPIKTEASCAVMVTYQPELSILLKLAGQLNQEIDFIIIDNGSSNIDEVFKQIQKFSHCKHINKLPENIGLAAALNLGIEYVENNAYNFAFLFDQDSSLCDNFINKMLSSFAKAKSLSQKSLAALGPRLVNPTTKNRTQFKVFNKILFRSDLPFRNCPSIFYTDFIITSGTLLNLACLPSVGKMKDSYFIDNIDLEWCFRAKSKNWEVLGTDHAELFHSIGENSNNFLVKSGIINQHNPSRSYFTTRNRFHLYTLPHAINGWIIRDRVRFIIKTTFLLVFSSKRKEYFNNIVTGYRDSKKMANL